MPQTRAATGQAGGLISVSGGDEDIPRQDRGRWIAASLAAQGAHRAHLVSHVGDRSAKTRKPGTPLLALIRRGRAVGLAAEGEDVLAHDLFPSAGPARLAGLYPFVNRRSAASTTPPTIPPPRREPPRPTAGNGPPTAAVGQLRSLPATSAGRHPA